jgi:hypothetical protein
MATTWARLKKRALLLGKIRDANFGKCFRNLGIAAGMERWLVAS